MVHRKWVHLLERWVLAQGIGLGYGPLRGQAEDGPPQIGAPAGIGGCFVEQRVGLWVPL